MRVHHRITSSTNDRARELAASGAPHLALVTAREQTAGRGREGRTWAGSPGDSLLMSLVLRRYDALLPLRAGLAVAGLAGPQALVKWPNDVLIEGRKVAGILVEARPQDGWAVLGIGVNVRATTGLPEELDAASLGRDDVEEALAELLDHLHERLEQPAHDAIADLRERDALLGRTVRWATGEGTGAGITDEGGLLVRTAAGDEVVLAGEVHLG
jgi:BirA family biotin operon repressor/biotin-[acetyl-CoA-carboxylase] ligase